MEHRTVGMETADEILLLGRRIAEMGFVGEIQLLEHRTAGKELHIAEMGLEGEIRRRSSVHCLGLHTAEMEHHPKEHHIAEMGSEDEIRLLGHHTAETGHRIVAKERRRMGLRTAEMGRHQKEHRTAGMETEDEIRYRCLERHTVAMEHHTAEKEHRKMELRIAGMDENHR